MFENVSEHLDEVLRLSERCPEKYQVPCFEALMRVLTGFNAVPGQTGDGFISESDSLVETQSYIANGYHGAENPISLQNQSQLGLVFADQFQIPSVSISQVYHLNGASYRIIVKDLKEKTSSKKQIKLALLLGIGELLTTGSPLFTKNRLIEACREYGTYDAPNFASHMKKQRDMFIAYGKNEWSLTVPAQQRAAEVIKELVS